MPSVASENSPIQHTRHHQPSNRTRNDSIGREPASPFADLLDSAAPANEPQPAPRNARAERSDTARPAENRRKTDHAERRDGSRSAGEARDSDATEDTGARDEAKATDETTAAAQHGEEAAAACDTHDEAPAVADDTDASLDAEFAAALAAMVGNTEQPAASEIAVTAALTPTDATVDPTASDTPAADPLAALKAAEQAAAAGGEDQIAAAAAAKAEAKRDAERADAKDAAKDQAQAKSELSADVQAAALQKDAGEDGETNNKGGQRSDHETRHAGAKPDTEKPEAKPRENHGADVSAVAKSGAAHSTIASETSTSASAEAAAATPVAPVVAVADNQPTALTATQLQAHIQAQLQASADTSPAVPLNGVAVEIASQALAGKNRFEIRLDPPELGRIDVKLDIDGDGNVTTRLVVERSDTLDLLKRDSSQLERALQQAGLKTSDNALEFSLQQEAFQQNDDGGSSNGAQIVLPDEDTPVHAQRQNYGRLLGMGGGLDIRI